MLLNRLACCGVTIMFVAIGAGPGCKTHQPEATPTAGLRIDVARVAYDKRHQRLEVRLRIKNENDQSISFQLDHVRLLMKGGEVAARSGSTRDPAPVVLQGASREFRWFFDIGGAPTPGNYPVEIRDILKGEIALGETATFSINA
jgi:hypothetical protein